MARIADYRQGDKNSSDSDSVSSSDELDEDQQQSLPTDLQADQLVEWQQQRHANIDSVRSDISGTYTVLILACPAEHPARLCGGLLV